MLSHICLCFHIFVCVGYELTLNCYEITCWHTLVAHRYVFCNHIVVLWCSCHTLATHKCVHHVLAHHCGTQVCFLQSHSCVVMQMPHPAITCMCLDVPPQPHGCVFTQMWCVHVQSNTHLCFHMWATSRRHVALQWHSCWIMRHLKWATWNHAPGGIA